MKKVPAAELSARSRFSQRTFAGAHGNGRDAPKADACEREVGRQSEQYHNRTAQTANFGLRGLRARNRGSMILTS